MTPTPTLTGVLDLVALQNAVTLLLCDDSRLSLVPILPEIKLHQESELEVDAIWMLPRSAFLVTPKGVAVVTGTGQVGSGLLVEMVGASSNSTGASGPPTNWEVSVVAFEERNTNLTAGVGIGLMSEQLAQIVKDILHLQNFGAFAGVLSGFGTLKCKTNWLTPAHDWMQQKVGVIAYRVSLEATSGVKQSTRSAAVVATFNNGMCTLTCYDGSASIYYTTDGTIPVQANPNAKIYQGEFAVTSGQTVMAASKRAGFISSEIWGGIAP